MTKDIYQTSTDMHKEHGGKLELSLKVPLETVEDLSLAYSPGVAGPCRAIAEEENLAKTLTLKKNTVAIVSDGSAVLGLGNIGAHAAIPVMEGKAALLKRFANVDAFPICLNTQDPDEIVEIVKQIAPVFGAVNLEDISSPRCFAIEERLRKELPIPVMHDDQHGTAIVTLAGLINACALRGTSLADARVVVSGAGAAGIAIVRMLLSYGVHNITVCDSKGIISHNRTDLNEEKQLIVEGTNPEQQEGTLADALVGADIFIGVSAPQIVSQDMVRTMAAKPVLFAMANPEPEIMPKEAIAAGAFVVGTGRSDLPNQVNNVLAFPGIFRGALDAGIAQFDQQMFIRAAEAIAHCVANPTPEKVIPSPFDKSVAQKVAAAIAVA